jgi:hypothetical protein
MNTDPKPSTPPNPSRPQPVPAEKSHPSSYPETVPAKAPTQKDVAK